MYQQAVMESEVGSGKKKELADLPSEVIATKSIKEKFERGAFEDHKDKDEAEDMSVFESGNYQYCFVRFLLHVFILIFN